jgi:serine/threonine protein kinase
MGNVYLAYEPRLERRVALKVIRPEFADDERFRRRFASESKAAAAIEHPRVVSVYRAGEHRGRLYLAMRYLRGVDLQQRVARGGPQDPARAAALIAQVAGALDAIHAAGLVHRDVKPGNVIVVGRNGSESAYLTDFGLAKAAASTSDITRTGEVIGSLDYLAPEQIEGGRVDARTDVYALGCVLFHLLTGEVPFPGGESSAKLWAHLNEPPPATSDRAGRHLAGLDPVLKRAMAKDPADRFPSAGDLGRAAIAAAHGEAVSEPERQVAAGEAAPAAETLPLATERISDPTPVRPRRRRRRPRRRRIAALAALTLIGLGVGAAIEVPQLTDGDKAAGAPTVEVPSVSGERLDLAEQELQQLGLRTQVQGGGVFGILITENWEVCGTSPAGGTEVRPHATVQFAVDRPGAC